MMPPISRYKIRYKIELSPLDITYEKRKAIKSQVLSDFTAEWLELQKNKTTRSVECMDNVL
jgi:hypothetical protein